MPHRHYWSDHDRSDGLHYKVDSAISSLGAEREQIGAVMNRLDHTIANLDNISTNLSLAKGRIEDANFATETSNLARTQVLQQASMAMLAQANASKQNIPYTKDDFTKLTSNT